MNNKKRNGNGKFRISKKARCVYEVSDVFSGENGSDDNVRLVHVENSHKLRMYVLFKTQLQREWYLLCVENKQ